MKKTITITIVLIAGVWGLFSFHQPKPAPTPSPPDSGSASHHDNPTATPSLADLILAPTTVRAEGADRTTTNVFASIRELVAQERTNQEPHPGRIVQFSATPNGPSQTRFRGAWEREVYISIAPMPDSPGLFLITVSDTNRLNGLETVVGLGDGKTPAPAQVQDLVAALKSPQSITNLFLWNTSPPGATGAFFPLVSPCFDLAQIIASPLPDTNAAHTSLSIILRSPTFDIDISHNGNAIVTAVKLVDP